MNCRDSRLVQLTPSAASDEESAGMALTPRKGRCEKSAGETSTSLEDTQGFIPPTFERHYSVEELAQTWGMSIDFVRRLFLCEPGVVVFWRQRPGRRVYRTLRIPESVAERVHRRMTKL